MRKRTLVCLIVLLALVVTTSVAWAGGKDDHKIMNKWDLSGTFVAQPGYNWGGMAEGATWTYRIHIKEAMNGDYSRGSIHFITDGVDVVGHVQATSRDYNYWSGDEGNLAAVGWAVYDDVPYYFMFLYAERAVWFCISTTSYQARWAGETVWQGAERAYQLHSLNTNDFPLDYKMIH